jgi:four helix bundle protein
MGVQKFEDLIAWQQARLLVREIYQMTRRPPFARDPGLSGQARRAAVSVMSNIAEGFERNRPREFHQALSTSKASCAEVRSLLYAALDAGYVDEAEFRASMDLAMAVGRLVGGLRSAVARRIKQSATHPVPGASRSSSRVRDSALSTQPSAP